MIYLVLIFLSVVLVINLY